MSNSNKGITCDVRGYAHKLVVIERPYGLNDTEGQLLAISSQPNEELAEWAKYRPTWSSRWMATSTALTIAPQCEEAISAWIGAGLDWDCLTDAIEKMARDMGGLDYKERVT